MRLLYVPDRLTLIGKYFILAGVSLLFPLNLLQPIQIKHKLEFPAHVKLTFPSEAPVQDLLLYVRMLLQVRFKNLKKHVENASSTTRQMSLTTSTCISASCDHRKV